jgi:hypothetical protein
MAWRRGQAYGQDLRDRVLSAEGEPIREVAERLSVSPSYVVKVRARLRCQSACKRDPGSACKRDPLLVCLDGPGLAGAEPEAQRRATRARARRRSGIRRGS